MALDDVVQNNKQQETNDYTGVRGKHERLRNPKLCPECGSDDTEEHPDNDYERVCNNCSILTYIPRE